MANRPVAMAEKKVSLEARADDDACRAWRRFEEVRVLDDARMT
jgi:hypothetical protein